MSMSIDSNLNPLKPNTLQLYLIDEPLVNTPIRFSVGYIYANSTLMDVTEYVTIKILNNVGATISNNSFIVNSDTIQTVYLEISLNNYYQYFSFSVHLPLPTITKEQIQTTFNQYLPKGVYSTSPSSYTVIDNNAVCSVLAELYTYQTKKVATSSFPFFEISPLTETPSYQTFKSVSELMFPDSGNLKWELALTGNNSLYLSKETETSPTTDYPALLQLIYQTNMNNSNNPYWLAYNLSQYIYLRLKIKKYVFVTDCIALLGESFILSLNSLTKTMINDGFFSYKDEINVYVLTDGDPLPVEFEQEFTNFCLRLIRPSFKINVYYDKDSSYFSMYDINDTYLGDTRQNQIACIQFNQGILSQALGKSSYKQYINITDYDVVLEPLPVGNTLLPNTTYKVTITTTPITINSTINGAVGNYYSLDSDKLTFELINGIQYLHTHNSGNVQVDSFFLYLNKTYNYVVS